MDIEVPDYGGGSLVNLVAELEHRLTGSSPSPRLHPHLADAVPTADTYVMVLFDGLGSSQLDHPAARDLATAHRGTIDAPFPYTTTVSLASVATGLPPSQHGLIAYHLWMEEVGRVVNTIHMTSLHGDKLDLTYEAILPDGNLWERLGEAGMEPISVQPGHFDRTPLSLTLYRGARVEPYWSIDDAIAVTVDAAAEPGRLVFLYVPHVDFAAHVAGQQSSEYVEAMNIADTIWRELTSRLPDDVGLVGTADHGHVDIVEDHKIRLPRDAIKDLILYGAERGVFVKGSGEPVANGILAEWVPMNDLADMWGPGPMHETFEDRRPDGILFADDGHAVFHKHSNDRLVGYHGGLMVEERQIPLLARLTGN